VDSGKSGDVILGVQKTIDVDELRKDIGSFIVVVCRDLRIPRYPKFVITTDKLKVIKTPSGRKVVLGYYDVDEETIYIPLRVLLESENPIMKVTHELAHHYQKMKYGYETIKKFIDVYNIIGHERNPLEIEADFYASLWSEVYKPLWNALVPQLKV